MAETEAPDGRGTIRGECGRRVGGTEKGEPDFFHGESAT